MDNIENGVKVSTQDLVDTAARIRSLNDNMDTKLNEMHNAVRKLEATYKSEGATAIMNRVENFKPRFAEYKAVVESYAKFLVDAASDYENVEHAIKANAEAVSNNAGEFSV